MTTSPVTSITDELLAELESEAEMATPGPWEADASPVGELYIYGPRGEFIGGAIDHVHDANLIALANPATIKALLAHIVDLKQQLVAARITAKPCIWKRDWETGAYDTDCGQKWHFTEGTPEEHGALFCHHCGGAMVVERRELFAYQVGDNDIVAAYDPAGAIQVLVDFAGYGEDFDEDDVELVSDKVLDNTEAFDQDEGKTITLEKTLRQELAERTEPGYLCGLE